MKRTLSLAAAILPAALLAQTAGRVIVRVSDAVELTAVPIAARAAVGLEPLDRLSRGFGAVSARRLTPARPGVPRLFVIELSGPADAERAAAAFGALPGVVRAEPDRLGQGGGDRSFVPDDTYYFRQWGLKNDGSFSLSTATAGADIDMESAWELEQGSADVTVAIIDSGVRLQHPDWGDRLWQNGEEVVGNGMDDDGNGFIDDWRGWDFANDDNDPADDQGHGSNVTSIVAAEGNNATGFTGVDLNCRAMVLKALNSANQGWYSWWIAAMYYAVDNGADIISMSMGGTDPSFEMQAAADYAAANDVLVVACMMNTNSATPFYPAALSGVMAVGATKPNDRRAAPFYWGSTSGSNYGNHISVCAPGDYIYGFSHLSNTGYSTYWSGTSQATPHVSALAALLKAQVPTRSAAEIRSIIEATAEDQVGDPLEDVAGWDPYHGHGRINAYQALLLAVSSGEAPLPAPRLTVFPNPGRGAIQVRSSHAGTVTVMDELGRMVHADRLPAGTSTLATDLPPGFYLIGFQHGQRLLTERLVVQ